MGIETLKSATLFAMKENLELQIVYPNYDLPEEYEAVLDDVDHVKIKPISNNKDADVIVMDGSASLQKIDVLPDTSYVLRISRKDLFDNYRSVVESYNKVKNLNLIVTDIEKFDDADIETYKYVLRNFSDKLESLFLVDETPRLNLITDRMGLTEMNNCGAGVTSVTLAPNGKFYVCPAFYYEDKEESIGDLNSGIKLKNGYLYTIKYAPICRTCDAFHCKRCVWLNRKTTLEINTPSYQQCVISHLERNESRYLMDKLRSHGEFLMENDIPEIDYLDPFNNVKR
ncbi:MAG: CXXX repeat peptide maturase [Prevotella sp.]